MGAASPEEGRAAASRPATVGRTPRDHGLPEQTVALLEAAGFSVAGALPIDVYDALVPEAWRSAHALPGARRALVLGTGGGAFERAWLAGPGGRDPADDLARDVVARAARSIEASTGAAARGWLYADRRALRADDPPVFADFVALAEACGLGVRSRLGLLLHPVHGPWWSARALVLTALDGAARVAGDPSTGRGAPDACVDCAAPCVEACPGGAVTEAGFDGATCAATRRTEPACADRCLARRACVVGPTHAYDARAESHYAAASLAWIRRAAAAAGPWRPAKGARLPEG